jgi:hypothetical protein
MTASTAPSNSANPSGSTSDTSLKGTPIVGQEGHAVALLKQSEHLGRHLRTNLPHQHSQDRPSIQGTTGGASLGFKDLSEACLIQLAPLQPRPSVVVVVVHVEPADEPLWKTQPDLVAGERLERAGQHDPTKIEDHRFNWRLGRRWQGRAGS